MKESQIKIESYKSVNDDKQYNKIEGINTVKYSLNSADEIQGNRENFRNGRGHKNNVAGQMNMEERKYVQRQDLDILPLNQEIVCASSTYILENSEGSPGSYSDANCKRNAKNTLYKAVAMSKATGSRSLNSSLPNSLILNNGVHSRNHNTILDKQKSVISHQHEVEDTNNISASNLSASNLSDCLHNANSAVKDIFNKQKVAMEFFQVALSKFQSISEDLSSTPEIFLRQKVALEFSQVALLKLQSVADDLESLSKGLLFEGHTGSNDTQQQQQQSSTSREHSNQEINETINNTNASIHSTYMSKSSPREIIDVIDLDSDEESDKMSAKFKEESLFPIGRNEAEGLKNNVVEVSDEFFAVDSLVCSTDATPAVKNDSECKKESLINYVIEVADESPKDDSQICSTDAFPSVTTASVSSCDGTEVNLQETCALHDLFSYLYIDLQMNVQTNKFAKQFQNLNNEEEVKARIFPIEINKEFEKFIHVYNIKNNVTISVNKNFHLFNNMFKNFSKSVEIVRRKNSEGVCFKALKDFPDFEKIDHVSGISCKIPDGKSFCEKYNNFSVVRDDSVFAGPLAYLSHSCAPNGQVHNMKENVFVLQSTKKILKGEEITWKYGSSCFNINCPQRTFDLNDMEIDDEEEYCQLEDHYETDDFHEQAEDEVCPSEIQAEHSMANEHQNEKDDQMEENDSSIVHPGEFREEHISSNYGEDQTEKQNESEVFQQGEQHSDKDREDQSGENDQMEEQNEHNVTQSIEHGKEQTAMEVDQDDGNYQNEESITHNEYPDVHKGSNEQRDSGNGIDKRSSTVENERSSTVETERSSTVENEITSTVETKSSSTVETERNLRRIKRKLSSLMKDAEVVLKSVDVVMENSNCNDVGSAENLAMERDKELEDGKRMKDNIPSSSKADKFSQGQVHFAAEDELKEHISEAKIAAFCEEYSKVLSGKGNNTFRLDRFPCPICSDDLRKDKKNIKNHLLRFHHLSNEATELLRTKIKMFFVPTSKCIICPVCNKTIHRYSGHIRDQHPSYVKASGKQVRQSEPNDFVNQEHRLLLKQFENHQKFETKHARSQKLIEYSIKCLHKILSFVESFEKSFLDIVKCEAECAAILGIVDKYVKDNPYNFRASSLRNQIIDLRVLAEYLFNEVGKSSTCQLQGKHTAKLHSLVESKFKLVISHLVSEVKVNKELYLKGIETKMWTKEDLNVIREHPYYEMSLDMLLKLEPARENVCRVRDVVTFKILTEIFQRRISIVSMQLKDALEPEFNENLNTYSIKIYNHTKTKIKTMVLPELLYSMLRRYIEYFRVFTPPSKDEFNEVVFLTLKGAPIRPSSLQNQHTVLVNRCGLEGYESKTFWRTRLRKLFIKETKIAYNRYQPKRVSEMAHLNSNSRNTATVSATIQKSFNKSEPTFLQHTSQRIPSLGVITDDSSQNLGETRITTKRKNRNGIRLTFIRQTIISPENNMQESLRRSKRAAKFIRDPKSLREFEDEIPKKRKRLSNQ